ncbi:protein kinase [Streptomyces sp. NBC_01537]|uniref:protein kinase domain-containing protein n=1 Tax=Streptomyces sp. NBC_01537 TaxID=2903896 RepID=UPI00386E3991
MAQTTAAGGPNEPSADGHGVPGSHDSPEQWGANGVVGDGRYRLTHRLGRGGMAEVFAAEDVRLGRIVAVKLLRSDLAEDPVSKARFTREAQSVAGLNHHAVVAVYDSGEDLGPSGAVPYIVMELVEGRTIRELLVESDEPPVVEEALVIVSGVLDALAYSHQHGIVHRDIKPANVIMTHAGQIKVMDFGIARALHGASTTMTQTGMVMGTPQYLSPEQALGKTVDTRSDLYATGCLLYELLALRPPFVGETPLAVVYQHVQDEARPPSTITDRVPPELDGLVMRALAKHPDDRFQTAEEMRGVVQYALAMLREQGGYTGTWSTGYVAQPGHTGASTPAMGVPGQTQGTRRLPEHATAEFGAPLLLGAPGDTMPPGSGPGGGYGGGGRGGNRWVKPVLFLLAAALAVSLGVYFAIANTGNSDKDNPVTPTQSQTTQAQTTEPSNEDTSTSSDDSASPSYSYQPTQSATPSVTPSATPSASATQSASPSASASASASQSSPAASASASGETDAGADGDGGGGSAGAAAAGLTLGTNGG